MVEDQEAADFNRLARVQQFLQEESIDLQRHGGSDRVKAVVQRILDLTTEAIVGSMPIERTAGGRPRRPDDTAPMTALHQIPEPFIAAIVGVLDLIRAGECWCTTRPTHTGGCTAAAKLYLVLQEEIAERRAAAKGGR